MKILSFVSNIEWKSIHSSLKQTVQIIRYGKNEEVPPESKGAASQRSILRIPGRSHRFPVSSGSEPRVNG